MKKRLPLSILLSALLLAACNSNTEAPSTDTPEVPQTADASVSPERDITQAYPLDTCVISGRKLDSMGGPYIHTHEGTEVRFCCDGCLPAFNRDPEKHLQKIEEAREMKSDSETDTENAHDH